MSSPRTLVIIALLVAASATLHLRAAADDVPPSAPIQLLPKTVQFPLTGMETKWTSRDIPIDASVLKLLGDGRFLNRIYFGEGPAQQRSPVGLFIGYFPTQRTGQAIHSPQNCLPGAGWTFLSSKVITVPNIRGTVGEYVITDGTTQMMVLYWYRSHGRSIANDFAAKAYMMADAVRYNRTDGALIRLTTPIAGDQTEIAHDQLTRFAETLAPILPTYIPD